MLVLLSVWFLDAPLPNSQLDRFLISMNIGLPTPEQELEILNRSRMARYRFGAEKPKEAGEKMVVHTAADEFLKLPW